jgi:hypothetical protein
MAKVWNHDGNGKQGDKEIGYSQEGGSSPQGVLVMQKTILIIDDNKHWQDIIPDWTVDGEEIAEGKTQIIYARNYYDGIIMLKNWKGLLTEVHIDFELGYGADAENGMDLLEWLEKNPEFIPPKMSACSGNIDNKMKMHAKMVELLKVKS